MTTERKIEKVSDEFCHADRDGDCNHKDCPQLRDGEPHKSGRSCPLNWGDDNDDA